jgi:hypothetical protein
VTRYIARFVRRDGNAWYLGHGPCTDLSEKARTFTNSGNARRALNAYVKKRGWPSGDVVLDVVDRDKGKRGAVEKPRALQTRGKLRQDLEQPSEQPGLDLDRLVRVLLLSRFQCGILGIEAPGVSQQRPVSQSLGGVLPPAVIRFEYGYGAHDCGSPVNA